MQDDRARAEALLFFNGKRDFLDEDEAVYASADVDPAIQELVASVQQQLPLLQKQAAQLSDSIEVHAAMLVSVVSRDAQTTGLCLAFQCPALLSIGDAPPCRCKGNP